MMHAYSEKYLNSATAILAEMVDYAVNDRGLDSDEFMHMFIVSGVAKQFERGNLRYITGRSGIEIADEVIQKIKNDPKTAANALPLAARTVPAHTLAKTWKQLTGCLLNVVVQYRENVQFSKNF